MVFCHSNRKVTKTLPERVLLHPERVLQKSARVCVWGGGEREEEREGEREGGGREGERGKEREGNHYNHFALSVSVT